jgi:hypothetical protein
VAAHNKKLTDADLLQIKKLIDAVNQAVGGDSATNTSRFNLSEAARKVILPKVEKLITREEKAAKDMPEVNQKELALLKAVSELQQSEYEDVTTPKAKQLRRLVNPSEESCAIM